MTQGTSPNSMPRRLLEALSLLVLALGMIAVYVRFTHGYPAPRWTSVVLSAVFGLLALRQFLSPQSNSPGALRYVLPAAFALLGILILFDALKG